MDEQILDGLLPETTKRFMLHYNFPPFSVGEVGRLGFTGRREIGHGNLAERSLKNLLPAESDFPYTVRIVSDILESNGSSSMATVCAGSLSLMDAGVPLKKPVAGIAMGLVKEGDRVSILSDILGNEDLLGRHGLQGRRQRGRHHRVPDGHQDPGDLVRHLRAGAGAGEGRTRSTSSGS